MRGLKSVALLVLWTTLVLLSVPAPQAAVPATVAAPDACAAQPAAVTLFTPPSIPHCGDYCSTPGAMSGCIDTSGGFWKRVICTCVGNSWVC